MREQIAAKPSISAAKLLIFLETLGYKVWAEPFMFRDYVDILKLVPRAGHVLNEAELRDYGLDLRKILVNDPEMSARDLLIAFNAAHGMCFVVKGDRLPYYLASIRQDITLWTEEVRNCCSGPMSHLPPLDENAARKGGDNVHQHFLRQWSITFCHRCGLRRFNGIRPIRKQDDWPNHDDLILTWFYGPGMWDHGI